MANYDGLTRKEREVLGMIAPSRRGVGRVALISLIAAGVSLILNIILLVWAVGAENRIRQLIDARQQVDPTYQEIDSKHDAQESNDAVASPAIDVSTCSSVLATGVPHRVVDGVVVMSMNFTFGFVTDHPTSTIEPFRTLRLSELFGGHSTTSRHSTVGMIGTPAKGSP